MKDLVELLFEPEFEQSISFVEDAVLNRAQVEVHFDDEMEQSTGSSDNPVSITRRSAIVRPSARNERDVHIWIPCHHTELLLHPFSSDDHRPP